MKKLANAMHTRFKQKVAMLNYTTMGVLIFYSRIIKKLPLLSRLALCSITLQQTRSLVRFCKSSET